VRAETVITHSAIHTKLSTVTNPTTTTTTNHFRTTTLGWLGAKWCLVTHVWLGQLYGSTQKYDLCLNGTVWNCWSVSKSVLHDYDLKVVFISRIATVTAVSDYKT